MTLGVSIGDVGAFFYYRREGVDYRYKHADSTVKKTASHVCENFHALFVANPDYFLYILL